MKGQASLSALTRSRDISLQGSRGLDLTGKYVLGQSLGAEKKGIHVHRRAWGTNPIASHGRRASGHREAWSGTPTGHHQLSGVRTAGWQEAAASWDAQFHFVFPTPAVSG